MTAQDNSEAPESPTPWSELERVWERSQTAIAAGDWESALELAERLHELRHASAYEVRALALRGAGRGEEAAQALVEGLALAPRLWRLWELLGVLQAELGRLDEADASYRNALRCPQAERISVGYHCALLRVLQGRLEEALEMAEALGELGGAEHGLRFHLLRARLLNGLTRHAEAIDLCNRALALDEREVGVHDGLVAGLHIERGKAYWLDTGDRERAVADLRSARALVPVLEGDSAELSELLAEG